MISSAYVTVTCNECNTEEQVKLEAIVRGWSESSLDYDIPKMGWTIVDDNTHLCPQCAEDADEEDEDEEE